jgi:hypothetical protein
LSTNTVWSVRERLHTGQYTLCYPRTAKNTYFLEIEVMTCVDQAVYDEGDKEAVMSACLTDPEHNVLNAPGYSFVDTPSARDVVGGPCWTSNATQVSALSTRIQPEKCFPYTKVDLPPSRAKRAGYALRRIPPKTRKLCDDYADLGRFEPYHMDSDTMATWKQTWAPSASDNGSGLVGKGGAPAVLCVFGDSHAKLLGGTMKNLIQQFKVRGAVADVTEALFLSELIVGRLTATVKAKKCTHAVVNLGQWSTGWPNHYPDPAKTFQGDLQALVSIMGSLVASGALASAWFVSLNYNPPGAMIVTCPPTDWRSRPFVDAYNRVASTVVDAEPNVGHIDNMFLVDPMWDSADDWCHYHGKVAEAMAYYTLHRLAGGRLPPRPPPSSFAKGASIPQRVAG